VQSTALQGNFENMTGLAVEDIVFPRPRDWSGLPRAEKTRMTLMYAAASEIYEKGFQAAALSDILHKAGTTKGALYHHFTDKHALGLLAMEHFIDTDMNEIWLNPFTQTDDPLSVLINLIGFMQTCGALDKGMKYGCPLVNLTEEMSTRDEAFRALVAKQNLKWRKAMEAALIRGQAAGNVRKDIDPEGVTVLIMAVRHGVMSQAKTEKDPSIMEKCAMTFFAYLNSLRPSGDAETVN